MKRFFLLWGPLTLLALFVSSIHVETHFEHKQALLLYGIVAVGTTVLSIAFSRNRLFLMTLLLGLPVLSSYYSWGWERVFHLFVPALSVVILFAPDRKLFSRTTAVMLGGILISLGIFLQFNAAFIETISKLGFDGGYRYSATILFSATALLVVYKKRGIEVSHFMAMVTSVLVILLVKPSPATWGILPQVMLLAGLADSMYRMSFKDQLTRISGRQALVDELNSLTSHYSIAMVDIDHFKKFNDTYGHKAGDEVLQKVAGLLTKVRHGSTYRYGGEEFTIVFKRRDAESAAEFCDEIRELIAESPYTAIKRATKAQLAKGSKAYIEKSVPVTISIGVADSDSISGGWQAVIKKADDLLYTAKKKGRNKVVAV